jgi:hypothetical protein
MIQGCVGHGDVTSIGVVADSARSGSNWVHRCRLDLQPRGVSLFTSGLSFFHCLVPFSPEVADEGMKTALSASTNDRAPHVVT